MPDAGGLGERVLLLGTGLTMIDAVFALGRPGRRFIAVSRRGLLPRAHDAAPPASSRADITGAPLDVFRQALDRARECGWREMVDEIRGSVRSLWASWSVAERETFLRHLRPWWEVHRHRMAPHVAHRMELLQRHGDLFVHAGAIRRLDLAGDQVRVVWRFRGERQVQVKMVDAVVNCTGHNGEIRLADDPLMEALLRRRLVRPDPCRLGLDVDARSRPLDVDGVPSPELYAVGPLTRGAFWEITSVPDIRIQAAETAADVRGALLARGPVRRAGEGGHATPA